MAEGDRRASSGRLTSRTPAAGHVVPKIRLTPINYANLFFNNADASDEAFRAAMERRLGEDVRVTPLGRARSGIYLLVKYALRTGRRKVLLSPFTIPDVVNMVALAGGEPVFFDTEPGSTRCDLRGLSALIDADTACVMVTHYHVNEDRLGEIASLCRQAGALLFDDCAIAMGGTAGGRPLGRLTDASIFSFSTFKLVNFFWGGLVSTRDPEIFAYVEAAAAAWPRLSLRGYAAQACKSIRYDLATRPLVFGRLVFPTLRRRALTSNRAHSLEWQRIENTTLDASLASRPHPAALAEWTRKLARVDGWLDRQRSIARVYARTLRDRAVSGPLTERDFADGCFSNFPVLVDPARRDEICHKMMVAGFDMGLHVYPNVHAHPRYSSASGVSANVARLVASSVYLPTHFAVSEDYAEAMARTLVAIAAKG
jgi:perosamine synthetase